VGLGGFSRRGISEEKRENRAKGGGKSVISQDKQECVKVWFAEKGGGIGWVPLTEPHKERRAGQKDRAS